MMSKLVNTGIKDEYESTFERVESILADNFKRLCDGQTMSIPLIKYSGTKYVFDKRKKMFVQQLSKDSSLIYYIRFPTSKDSHNHRFVIYLKVLTMIHELLRTKKIATKRDIFYKDKGLFVTQKVVDGVIDHIAFSLGIERQELNIVASPKGLIYADIIITTKSGQVLELKKENGETVVPVDCEIECIRPISCPKGIIVVEKEAVFRELCQSMQNYFIITGKGFPDYATSKIIRNLSVCLPDIPIYGIVDSDPYGLMIFVKYKFGSKIAYQNDLMAVPRMIYLGVSIADYNTGWLPLTKRDITMAFSILNQSYMSMLEFKNIKDELQLQLFLGKKAEMNVFCRKDAKGITSYIEKKIRQYKD